MAKETKEELVAIIEELKTKLKESHDRPVDYRKIEMQEKLYEAGIEPRPTIMQNILDRENELIKTIKYLIEECEKETGREFLFPIYFEKMKQHDPMAEAVSWLDSHLEEIFASKR